MKLLDYLDRKNLGIMQFSEKTGIPYQKLRRSIMSGKKIALETAKEIVEATDGEVTYIDIYNQNDKLRKRYTVAGMQEIIEQKVQERLQQKLKELNIDPNQICA